jgi:hypothetical protein
MTRPVHDSRHIQDKLLMFELDFYSLLLYLQYVKEHYI